MKHSLFYFSFLFCFFCQKYPADVRMALEQAGENRGQLELVLNKYYGHNDQKYKATCFLIANNLSGLKEGGYVVSTMQTDGSGDLPVTHFIIEIYDHVGLPITKFIY